MPSKVSTIILIMHHITNSVKMKTSIITCLLSLCFLFCGKHEADAQENSKLTFSGYLDAYYAYDFNKPESKDRQFTNSAARHNEFNINHAYIMGDYKADNIRGVLALQTGTYPIFNYAAEPNESYRMIYQAYAGVKILDNVWLDAGIFPGHTGYEHVESIENELYTRALATEYTPYYQTGVRVTAELSDKFTWTTVLVNGWQNIVETNDSKAFGMNFNFRPNDQWELNYGNYFGDEGDSFLGSRYRFFHHAYVKYQISSSFHTVLSMDRGTQELGFNDEKGTFYFFTLIAQYFINEKISLAFRFEEVNDDDDIISATSGFNGFSGQVSTLNFNYHLSEKAIFRVESKLYRGTKSLFFGSGSAERDTEVVIASIAMKF